MGTSASIICHTGSYTWATDVHYDGYILGAGLTLQNFYSRLETVQPLVHGGALSGLAPQSGYAALDDTDAEKEKLAQIMADHSYRKPVPEISVYYHRDRNEPWNLCKYRTYSSVGEAVEEESCRTDYVYLWHEPTGRWYLADWERSTPAFREKARPHAQPVIGIPLSFFIEYEQTHGK